MGGGILPVAIYKGEVYFLFGRESRHINHKASGLWSDFGGAPEMKENRMETAAREGWEETEGVLGSQEHIKFMVENRCIKRFNMKNYTSFVIPIYYTKSIIAKHKKIYEDAWKNTPELVLEENGIYEKDRMKWFTIEELEKNIKKFRPWYRTIVKKIIKYYK